MIYFVPQNSDYWFSITGVKKTSEEQKKTCGAECTEWKVSISNAKECVLLFPAENPFSWVPLHILIILSAFEILKIISKCLLSVCLCPCLFACLPVCLYLSLSVCHLSVYLLSNLILMYVLSIIWNKEKQGINILQLPKHLKNIFPQPWLAFWIPWKCNILSGINKCLVMGQMVPFIW